MGEAMAAAQQAAGPISQPRCNRRFHKNHLVGGYSEKREIKGGVGRRTRCLNPRYRIARHAERQRPRRRPPRVVQNHAWPREPDIEIARSMPMISQAPLIAVYQHIPEKKCWMLTIHQKRRISPHAERNQIRPPIAAEVPSPSFTPFQRPGQGLRIRLHAKDSLLRAIPGFRDTTNSDSWKLKCSDDQTHHLTGASRYPLAVHQAASACLSPISKDVGNTLPEPPPLRFCSESR